MTEHKVSDLTKELAVAFKKSGLDFGAHSVFSPSASSMWAYCSGSLIPNLFAKDSSGAEAAYGSVAHGVAEEWLISVIRPDHLLGETREIKKRGSDEVFSIQIDISMMDYVEQYVSWCINLPGVHFVETKVDFSDLTPLEKQTGTADHAACIPKKLVITDLKMGSGVQVFAKDNTQAIIYAYGFFRKYDELFDFETIVIRIAQPRLGHFDEWVITRTELLEWAKWIKNRAYAAWCKDALRTPGEKQCRFCKVKRECSAFAVFMTRLTDGVFDNLDDPITVDDMTALASEIDSGFFSISPIKLGALNTQQKAVILKYRGMIESWLKSIYDDLSIRCINGEKVPGFKPADSKTNRVFVDKAKAVEELEFYGLDDEVIRPRGMISPAQAEDALRKIGYKRKLIPNLLEPLVVKPEGKPVMVPDSDKRPEIKSLADQTFENLEEL